MRRCGHGAGTIPSAASQVPVLALLRSLPMLGDVLLLCAFVFFLFGVIAVQLFAGALRNRCAVAGRPDACGRRRIAQWKQCAKRAHSCSKGWPRRLALLPDPPWKQVWCPRFLRRACRRARRCQQCLVHGTRQRGRCHVLWAHGCRRHLGGWHLEQQQRRHAGCAGRRRAWRAAGGTQRGAPRRRARLRRGSDAGLTLGPGVRPVWQHEPRPDQL